MSQKEIIESLPIHLRPFVKTQAYEDYSPRDHAVWRFVLKQLLQQLSETAHPVFIKGLELTGISKEHVPSIDEMNSCLEKLGWRAVVVDGFIPPAIFMEFQALKVLVIAVEMRSVEHIFYTPAPDIVHESAGHAPFIVDVDYAEFLQRFGEVGMKAIATKEDLEQYEAIRNLSILKECPNSDPEAVKAAEELLSALAQRNSVPSEAALLTRLHWWTVEYGLVGELDDYRIFGAGLLSSLGESHQCLNDDVVKKVPLTVDAVDTAYDITNQQPQLFVTKSCKHLTQVLEEFAASMCFKRGGTDSLLKAIAAESVCTAAYDTGVQISGEFCEVLSDAVGNATYLRTQGPTQLAYKDRELFGHGVKYHRHGFGSPIGFLKDFSRCLSQYTVDELRAHDIVIGEVVKLEYLSGITVQGVLKNIVRQDQRNLVLSFAECTVTDVNGRLLFDPAWGTYDLTVGARVVSVYGGAADREKLQLFKPTPRTDSIRIQHDADLMKAYEETAELSNAAVAVDLGDLSSRISKALLDHPEEWLLRVELLQVAAPSLAVLLRQQLIDLKESDKSFERVVDMSISAGALALSA